MPAEAGDDSRWVVLNRGGVTTVMVRDTYERMTRPPDAPDPSQRDLDELLPTVARARVLSGGLDRGRVVGSEVLVDTTDPTALAGLREALRLQPDPPGFARCACLGGPTIELYASGEVAALLGLQHGNAIRWARWRNDGPLADGRLTRRLTDRGIDPGLLDLIYHNQYEPAELPPAAAALPRAEQLVRMAELHRDKGDLPGALQEVDAALADDPDLPAAFAVRTALRPRLGDHAGAIADCDAAIARGFRHAEVYFTRALAHAALGRPDRAEADCTAAVGIDPGHHNAWNSRGIFRMQAGRFDEALSDFAEAMRLAPDWEHPFMNRSNIRVRQGDQGAAIADLTKFLELSRHSGRTPNPKMMAMTYWNRGPCYREKGEAAKAESDFREAAARDPEIASRLRG